MDKKTNVSERNVALDILRIIAALGVVILHVSSDYIVTNDVNSANFAGALFINSLTRFAVPVFVMISGSIFLDKNKIITVKKIWTHNILRLAVIYAVWSFAYYAFECLYFWKSPILKGGPVGILNGMVYSTNHLWFIGMIIGLYAITPVIKEWIGKADEKNIRYFLLIYLLFQIAATTLKVLINKTLTDSIFDFFNVAELSGYIGYYVLGWYLCNYELPKKMKSVLYVMFPVGIAANFIIALVLSRKTGGFSAGIYDSFGLFTYFNTITLFTVVLSIGKKIGKNRILSEISKDTLGIYVMHMMIWTYIKTVGATDVIPNSVLGSLAYPILMAIGCIIVAEGLRRIPFVGRYLC